MRKKFVTMLLSLSVIGGAPFLLSACNTATGAGEDIHAAVQAISGGTTKPETAQAQQSQPLPPTAFVRDARVEARIKSLHQRLKITSAEEPQWSRVAQAMRDNAQQMQAAIEQRRQARSLTAIDDLKAYQTIADVHAQGLETLIPAFQALYDSMSDDQKKLADAIFSKSHRHQKSTHKTADAGPQLVGNAR
jgi:predicted small secreted protein